MAMALADDVVEQVKAASLSQNPLTSRKRVAALILCRSSSTILEAFDSLSEAENAFQSVMAYARALFYALGPDAKNDDSSDAATLLLRVTVKLLELVHAQKLAGEKQVIDCLAFLCQEMESLPRRRLPSVVESIVSQLEKASELKQADECASLQLLPQCLSLMMFNVDKVIVPGYEDEESEMRGEEYRNKVLQGLLALAWSNVLVTKIASLIREIPMDLIHTEEFLKKIFRQMRHVEPQDLPSLIYQLLLIAAKGFKRSILTGIIHFFNSLDGDDIGKKSRENGKKRSRINYADMFEQVKGTVVLHVNFSVKQDPPLGQELLSIVRTACQPMTAFEILVLLSISRIQRFEQASLELLKTAVLTSYRDAHRCRSSYWASSILGPECQQVLITVEDSFMKAVQSNSFGWDHIVPSIVQIGFVLVECATASRPVLSDDWRKLDAISGSQELGVRVLVAAFQSHEISRHEIIEQSKFRIIGLKPQQSYPIIRMLALLVQSCPPIMLEYGTRLKECLDYFSILNKFTASSLVGALYPLFQMSCDLMDYMVLVLRKSIFHREATARMVAVQGLLDLAIAEKGSKFLRVSESLVHSASEASCSQSGSQPLERNYSGKQTHLFHELLGLFRRCLSQQASVREILYNSLPKLLLVDPSMAETIFDLLWPHFCQFYAAGEDNTASLHLSSCTAVQNDIAHIQEPLDHLLHCIHQLLVLQPHPSQAQQSAYAWTSFGFSLSQDQERARVSTGESFSLALLSLRKGLQVSSLGDFGLGKTQNFTPETAEGQKNLEQARMLIGVLEVMIDAALSEVCGENSAIRIKAEKEVKCYIVLHDSLQQSIALKGKGNSKGSTKLGAGPKLGTKTSEAGLRDTLPVKSNPFLAPQSSLEKRMPHLSSSTIAHLLKAGICKDNQGDTTALQENSKESFSVDTQIVAFALRSCLQHLKGVAYTPVGQEKLYSNLSKLVGNDWRVIAYQLAKVLLTLTSSNSLMVNATQDYNKDKPNKGKKTGDETPAGLILTALKCVHELISLGIQRSCLVQILKNLTLKTGAVNSFEDTEESSSFEDNQGMTDELKSELIHGWLLREMRPFLQELLASSKYTETEVVAGTVLLLASKLPPALMKQHGAWANLICKDHQVVNVGAARALGSLTVCLSISPEDLNIAQCIASELLRVTGSEESEAIDSSDEYPIVNSSTQNGLAGFLLQHSESILSDIEWLISKLKIQTVGRSSEMQSDSQDKSSNSSRVKLEDALHKRLESLVSLLSIFTNMNLACGPAEQFLKVTGRLYKCLAAATRLCIAPKGFRQPLPSDSFQRLTNLTCKNLTGPLYTFVAIMQRDQQENVQTKFYVNKIKREGKTIPNLIFYVEDYERYLIQLSKITKVNLMRHAKRSTARDFKILDSSKKNKVKEEDNNQQQNPEEDIAGTEHGVDLTEVLEAEQDSEDGSGDGPELSREDTMIRIKVSDDSNEEADEEEQPVIHRSSNHKARKVLESDDDSDTQDVSGKRSV
ncbi:hypothetical protein O6H91_Y113100 [Diphasiastrum complanatum]|nr:hypothetical protein O6H91_Y113100 [Diphasiastrum complanatum]